MSEPTALERLAQLQAAGQVRLCRQTKPITEAEAQIVLDFADQLRSMNLDTQETR